MSDFVGLLRRWVEARVDFVLVGGLAAATHGCTLLTQDVDFCIRLGGENLNRLADALRGLEPVHRMMAAAIPFQHDAETLSGFKNVYRRTKLAQLDWPGEVLGLGDFEAVNAQSDLIDLGGVACRVISLDALIPAKTALGRDRDLAAVEQLRRIRVLRSEPDATH